MTSIAQWAIGGAWQSAHRKDPVFLFLGKFLRCLRASEFLGRHKVLFSAFDCNQPGHHLPGYGQCGAVAIASLFFLFVDQGQFMALPGCKLGSFNQHLLNVLVTLLGNGCAHDLVSRTLLRSAQSA